MIVIFLGYTEFENTFQRSHCMWGKIRIWCKSTCTSTKQRRLV